MFFSIVIPTHNRAPLLREALASAFVQTFKDFEIIVVDDGSTDNTLEILRDYAELQVLTQSNRGPGAARNLGARESKGQYLAFLDSDDIWFPWTLASFAEFIERHDRPAILGAHFVEFSDTAELKAVMKTPLQAEVFADYFASHHSTHFVGGCMSVLRRDYFMKSGGYSDQPINLEDHDLILRMGDAPGFVKIVAPVTLGWRRHAGSVTRDLSRSVVGGLYLVEQEQRGGYPGGGARRWQRREIIARHVRPVSLACLHENALAEAWRLYWATFSWHLRLRRWKYLAGFPVKALFGWAP